MSTVRLNQNLQFNTYIRFSIVRNAGFERFVHEHDFVIGMI